MTKLSARESNKVSESDIKERRVVDFVKSLDERLFAFLGARLLSSSDHEALQKTKRSDTTMDDVEKWRSMLPLDEIIDQFRAEVLVSSAEYSRQFIPASIMVLGDALHSDSELNRIKAATKLLELNNLIGDSRISTSSTQMFLDNMERALDMVKSHADWDEVEECGGKDVDGDG